MISTLEPHLKNLVKQHEEITERLSVTEVLFLTSDNTVLLLTQFEVCTVSYGPRGKTRFRDLQYALTKRCYIKILPANLTKQSSRTI